MNKKVNSIVNNSGGKGSLQRPTNHERFSTSWDRIFGTQNANTAEAAMPEQSMKMEQAIVSPAGGIAETQKSHQLSNK